MATNNFLKCGLINIQSVRNKTYEINELITDESLDILCLTETWLNEFDSAVIKEMSPYTHSFLHLPRNNRVGGGVGLFLHNSFTHIRMINRPKFTSFEFIEVTFKYHGCNILFIIVYRPPNSSTNDFFDQFDDLLERIDLIGNKVIICGDFNFWMDIDTNINTKKFTDLLESHQLLNFIHGPTSSSGHSLDLVISHVDGNFIHNLVIEENRRFASVHKLITYTIPIVKDKWKKNIVFRNKSNFSPSEFILETTRKSDQLEITQCIHNNLLYKYDCVDCLTNIYNTINRSEYDNLCPEIKKTITVVNKSPWFNSATLEKKREKRRFEKKWRRLKSDEAWRAYCEVRNQYNELLKREKIKYYKNEIEKAGKDMRKLYCILNGLTGYVSTKTLPDGYSDQELANNFLVFFKEKIENIIHTFTSITLHRNVNTIIVVQNIKLARFQTIQASEVIEIMSKMKKTHCALDPMPMTDIIVAENFPDIVKRILRIINTSILTCRVPISEKTAAITPSLKGSLDPQSLSSYRPISNLSYLSKILENVILKQLNIHLKRVNAIPDNQSAYRPLHSTETTITSVVSDLLTVTDEGNCAILILLDLSAAFDTVVHELLFDDLRSIGIVDEALELLKDYLNNRKYYVRIGNSVSSVESLTRGVPQGSVLGPVLFCIYTSGLSRILQDSGVEFKIFADDTQLYLTISDIQVTCAKIGDILNNIEDWMNFKQLKLNINKTEYLLIGKNSDLKRLKNTPLIINNNQIRIVEKVKDLGVYLDSNLSMDAQISNVVKITGYHLRNIAFIRKYIDVDSTKKLVYNFVISRLDYCNSIYYNLPKYKLRKLQCIFNRAARLIVGVGRRDHITPVLIRLHWLPIKARVIYKICLLAHTAIVTGKPVYILEMLNQRQPRTGTNTRSDTDSRKLVEPRCFTNLGFRAFRSAAPRLYNKLPSAIRMVDNLASFKKKLKTHLFSEVYDIQDSLINESYKV